MSIINQLAYSLGINSEEPNKELARKIAANNDKKAIEELVANLNNKVARIQSNCIKTLYEAGELKPELTAPYAREFIALLDNKNNRLVWGAMTALSGIVAENAALIYDAIAKIVAVADKGTVITKDHAVNILVQLGAIAQYNETAVVLVMEQLLTAPENQFPTYAEKAAPIIQAAHKAAFLNILTDRLPGITTGTKKKRVEKLIKKLSK
jgi:hypothetical protein